jgi:hypothetical protein
MCDDPDIGLDSKRLLRLDFVYFIRSDCQSKSASWRNLACTQAFILGLTIARVRRLKAKMNHAGKSNENSAIRYKHLSISHLSARSHSQDF